jgi:hypothetical protein
MIKSAARTVASVTASFYDGVSMMINSTPSVFADSTISASLSGWPSNTVAERRTSSL